MRARTSWLLVPLLLAACASRPRLQITPEAPVLVYGAPWCRYTRAAETWFQDHRIPVTRIDVERDLDAQDRMEQSLRDAGIGPSGIPVVDIQGRLVVGYDPEGFERALRGR